MALSHWHCLIGIGSHWHWSLAMPYRMSKLLQDVLFIIQFVSSFNSVDLLEIWVEMCICNRSYIYFTYLFLPRNTCAVITWIILLKLLMRWCLDFHLSAVATKLKSCNSSTLFQKIYLKKTTFCNLKHFNHFINFKS